MSGQNLVQLPRAGLPKPDLSVTMSTGQKTVARTVQRSGNLFLSKRRLPEPSPALGLPDPKRAGCDGILTYFAPEVAALLKG